MLNRIWKLITTSFGIWNNAKAARMAAAMTYYTMLSLAPLLTLAIAIASFFFEKQLAQEEIIAQVSQFTTPEISATIANLVKNVKKPNSDIVIGSISLAILIFGASGVFSQLHDTFNDIWQVPQEKRSGVKFLLRKRFMGVVMVLLVGILLLTTLVESAMVGFVSHLLEDTYPRIVPLVTFADRAVSYLLMPFIFSLVFRFVPAAKLKFSDVWLAGMLTAILFAGSRYLIELYLRFSATSELYGAAGSLVVLLIWIYMTGLLVFYGAAFSHAWALIFGSRSTSSTEYISNPDEVIAKMRKAD